MKECFQIYAKTKQTNIYHTLNSNGRAVHYNGSSLLQWKSVRLNITLGPGDVVGCGWEKYADGRSGNANEMKGIVFFTFNGMRLPAVLEDVLGGMWPIVHIQKKVSSLSFRRTVFSDEVTMLVFYRFQNTRIKANFGHHPFKYSIGHEYRFSAPKANDCLVDEVVDFDMLPFHDILDLESDAGGAHGKTCSSSPEQNEAIDVLPCIIPSNPRPKKGN